VEITHSLDEMTFVQAGNNSFNKREKAAEDMYVKEQEKANLAKFKVSVKPLAHGRSYDSLAGSACQATGGFGCAEEAIGGHGEEVLLKPNSKRESQCNVES
jgi:hypothetical protein